MITYNHEKFIGQAIESVLMQETDFPVELIIGEDCSTDGTRPIVKRYAEQYPNVIRALLPDSNMGMQRNATAVTAACRGDYVACLEGDDYWTSPNKLQSQVQFMEANLHYSMCGTANRDVMMSSDGNEIEVGLYPTPGAKSQYGLEDVMADYPFRTLTFMLRNGLVRYPEWYEKAAYGDVCILALYGEKGPIAYLNEVTATYRMHTGGVWTGAGLGSKLESMRATMDLLNDHFGGRYSEVLQRRDFLITKRLFREVLGHGDTNVTKRIYRASISRFFPHMFMPFIALGLEIYGFQYLEAVHRLTMWLAIRTRIRRLLQRI